MRPLARWPRSRVVLVGLVVAEALLLVTIVVGIGLGHALENHNETPPSAPPQVTPHKM